MKKNSPQSIMLALIITVSLIIFSMVLINSISVEVLDDSIIIKGLYGTEISYADIEEIRELDTIPLLGIKTNGINLGFMNIGMFTYKELGKIRLFEIKKEKPYILIVGKTEKIILGLGKEKNEAIYNNIKEKINNNQR